MRACVCVCAKCLFFIWSVKRDLIAPIKPCEIACGSLKWEVKTNASTRTSTQARALSHTHTPIDSIVEQTTGYKMTDVFANLILTYIQIKRSTESVATSAQNRCFGANRIVSTLLLLYASGAVVLTLLLFFYVK